MAYRLISDGAGYRSKVVDTTTGNNLFGVCRAVVTVEVDSVNTMTLDLVGGRVDVRADRVSVAFADPLSGETKAVSEVKFEDGSGFIVEQGRIIATEPG